MFYVDGKQGDNWAIADTEDSVVEYHDAAYIKRCVKNGIKIYGVSGNTISVYDFKGKVKAAEAKTELLTGFRMTIYPDGTLMDIEPKDGKYALTDGILTTSLEIGKYCRVFGHDFLKSLAGLQKRGDYYDTVVLTVDDRIKLVKAEALKSISWANVALDIRTLKNRAVVDEIYRQILRYLDDVEIDDHLYDVDTRAWEYRG